MIGDEDDLIGDSFLSEQLVPRHYSDIVIIVIAVDLVIIVAVANWKKNEDLAHCCKLEKNGIDEKTKMGRNGMG